MATAIRLLILIVLFFPSLSYALEKNTASQYWAIFCFDETDNTPVTGDAANITGDVYIDAAVANAIDDTNPTEKADGYYLFGITAAESNGDYILIDPDSTTANVQCVGAPPGLYTVAPDSNSVTIANNAANANVTYVGGNAAASTVAGLLDTNVTYWEDSAVSDADGVPDVNVTTIEGGDATDALDTAADTVTVTSIGANVVTAAAVADAAIDAATFAADVDAEIASYIDGSGFSALPDVTLANGAHGGAAATITLSDYSDFQGAAGDPWATALPGAYGAGSAGYIVGNNLDDSVGDLTTDVATMQGNVTDILADTAAYDTDGEYATAIWNAATVSYGGAGTYGQAVEDIVADTNELQTDDIPGTLTSIDGKIDTIDDYVDTEVAAILEDTGTTLPATLGTPGDLGSGATLADNLADIEGQTDDIGVAGVGLTEAGGDGDHLTAIDLPNQTMDITGSLSGSVGSVTGAVGSVTGDVGGNVTGSVGSLVGHTVQTGDSFARIGAPAGASIAADIAENQTDLDAILDDTGTSGVVVADHSGFQKNVAVTAFSWLMVDNTDHVTPETGLQATLRTTGNAQISCDGGAFADLANIASINHVASGIYEVDLSAAEMNCDAAVLRFLAAGTADQRTIYIKTSD